MELEKIVANNITELRKSKQWTQLELAEKTNYSDKTVSKWECGDGLPDLKTICKMAELFGVTIDFFVTEGASASLKSYTAPKEAKGYHLGISLLEIVGIWFAVTICFVYILLYRGENYWTLFSWGVPASVFVLSGFNRKWGERKYSVIYSSILCWTLLAAVYLQMLQYQYNMWAIFFIGIPIQVAIILWNYVKLKYR